MQIIKGILCERNDEGQRKTGIIQLNQSLTKTKPKKNQSLSTPMKTYQLTTLLNPTIKSKSSTPTQTIITPIQIKTSTKKKSLSILININIIIFHTIISIKISTIIITIAITQTVL
jgi:hypothetical protein